MNSKVLKLIVTLSRPKLASHFGLFQYCWNSSRRSGDIISGAYSKMAYKGPRPLVVCGPSGSGKGTLLKKLFKEFPNTFGLSVSHTTRAPRPGETDGIHYHFTDEQSIMVAIDRGEFLEQATFGGNRYGTSKKAVQAVQDTGKVCVLEIDIEGAKQIRNCDLNPIYVFIMPPSIEELRRRLTGRNTENVDKIEERLRVATKEIEYGKANGNFDKVILNHRLKEAYAELRDFIVQELEKQQKEGVTVSLTKPQSDY